MRMSPRILLVAIVHCAIVSSISASADEKTERRRAEFLAQMRTLAEQTEIRLAKGDAKPELVKDPVFRYDDQPRRFIDATIWAWTDQGRPVAFQKIEAIEYGEADAPSALWQYCFASVSPGLLTAQWPQERRFRATDPGVAFRPLADSPEIPEGNTQRKRQARELARKFSARIVTSPKNNIRQEMRLLTTPIFEYAHPKTKEYLGAVYGFSTNGTNPDLLVVLEIHKEKGALRWRYAPARMTCCAVNLAYEDSEVWNVDWVNGSDAPFPTWTFFATPRVLEEKP
jgi:hypothetical protein